MNNATSAEERKSVPVENTQQNPIFDNRLWRTLMKVDILLWAIIFLFILFFAANAICTSAFGTSFVHFLHGTSMEPTMNEGTWVVSKRVPFDELKVGDIITFRERKDATISITGEWKSNLTPVWMDGETVAEEAEKETPEPEETEEPTAKPIEYTDDTIMHRIIKIDEEGIHTQEIIIPHLTISQSSRVGMCPRLFFTSNISPGR